MMKRGRGELGPIKLVLHKHTDHEDLVHNCVALANASPKTLITRLSDRVTLKTLIHASVSYST